LFESEGILTADLDLGKVIEGRYDFDAAGHYARNDVFRLVVNRAATPPVEVVLPAGTPPGAEEAISPESSTAHADSANAG
jgi:nitrilase